MQQLPGDEAEVERTRRYTRMIVEGFDAADPRIASTRALAEEWNGDDTGQTSRQFRPLGGYEKLLRALLRRARSGPRATAARDAGARGALGT